jgi:hypothetical protein
MGNRKAAKHCIWQCFAAFAQFLAAFALFRLLRCAMICG